MWRPTSAQIQGSGKKHQPRPSWKDACHSRAMEGEKTQSTVPRCTRGVQRISAQQNEGERRRTKWEEPRTEKPKGRKDEGKHTLVDERSGGLARDTHAPTATRPTLSRWFRALAFLLIALFFRALPDFQEYLLLGGLSSQSISGSSVTRPVSVGSDRRGSRKPNEFGITDGGTRSNGSKRYDEWRCESCSKRNFMFKAECRQRQGHPTP